MKKLITVEEHFAGAPIHQYIGKYAAQDAPYMPLAQSRDKPIAVDPTLYVDLHHRRIEDMDRHGIDMQILSCSVKSQLLPPLEGPAIVRDTNDYAAEVVAAHPDRYRAFATLPWSAPGEAVKEAQRARDMGFCGVMLVGRASPEDRFLDAEEFVPVLEACEALSLPIYVHPGAPLKAVREPYYGGLGEEVSARLSLHGWGWHNEAGIQLLRVILAGRLEQFPRLRLIAGHWGEMVPFYLSRLDQSLPPSVTGFERTVSQIFRQAVYVTPSSMFDLPQLNFCMEVLGPERILYSVDCPFFSNEGARAFLEEAPLSPEDREKIAWRNASKLFDL